MNPLRWLSVSLSHATVEAPTVLSLIGCTRLRAVSGILRTQRGRRGSRGAGQHAGTGSAGPGRHGRPGPISTDLASRPCGSSLSLAPVAQVSRSLLWINPRPCGSTLAGVGCVLVCRIAGPYRHCRPRWAQWGGLGPGLPYVDRRLHRLSGARRQSEPALSCARMAGTSQCGGPSAPRGCASLGVTGLCAATQTPSAWHHCGCTTGHAWHTGPGPGHGQCPGRPTLGAPVAASSTAPSVQRPCQRSLLHPASGPSPFPPAGPCRLGWGPGSRISRPPRPEVTIRHVTNPSTPFSRLHEHDCLTRAAPPPRPAPVKPCGRCKHPHSALKPCTGLFDYLCALDLRSPRSSCALDPLDISALNFQISRITLLRANQS